MVERAYMARRVAGRGGAAMSWKEMADIAWVTVAGIVLFCLVAIVLATVVDAIRNNHNDPW